MKELLDIIAALRLDNNLLLFVGGIYVLGKVANYTEPLNASKVEIVLMDKNDLLKRNSFPVILLFCIFVGLNFAYILNDTFLAVNIMMFFVSVIGGLGICILNKFEKYKTSFARGKETLQLALVMSFFGLITHAIIIVDDMNKVSCVFICALVETIIVFLSKFSFIVSDSKIKLNIENTEWYVLRRMDDRLLCGDAKNSIESEEYRIVEIKEIAEKGLCFRNSKTVTKGE